MKAVLRWQGLATVASVAVLAGGLAAITPGVAVAATHSCGSKTIVFERPGENGAPPSKFKLSTVAISTAGVSCQAAYSFLTKLYNSTSGTPEKYKCTVGHFKVPAGKVPEVCTRPGKRIQWGGQGG
ncbi:MAG TPA: hypothetical protein VG188_02830 [Solirubrobacteraceae bacterium]|jgi:hypothetical protein|nr:hypothetical protein [Solirubrobacteraceae bacterium]